MKDSELLIYKRDNGELEMSSTTEEYSVVEKDVGLNAFTLSPMK